MIDTKELRRLTQAATPGPWQILPIGDGRQKFAVADSEFLSILTVTDEGDATFGTVYDDADAEFIAAANPAVISELLDRLEAAEKDVALKERVIDALGSELNTVANKRDALRAEIEELHVLIAAVKKRADAEFRLRVKKEEEYTRLRAKLEAAEKKHDDVAQQLVQSEIGKRKISEAHNAVTRRLSVLADENAALRAKIEQMERQGPVGEIVAFGESLHEVSWIKGKLPPLGAKLYALPGATGEEK